MLLRDLNSVLELRVRPCGSDALACPSCGRLTHAQEFDALAQHAKLAGQAGDWHGAKLAWEKALPLLPPGSEQYRTAKARIENINLQLSDKSVWAKRAAKLGPAGVLLWKFKTIALLVLTKGKLVLLGLTKLSTFASMMAFFAVYWSIFGWKFALGFVLSIYIHEMGHVIALRKYGIAATSPMFIPFVGAIVRLRQYPANVAQDARVGLGRPDLGTGRGSGRLDRCPGNRPSDLVRHRPYGRMAEPVQLDSRLATGRRPRLSRLDAQAARDGAGRGGRDVGAHARR